MATFGELKTEISQKLLDPSNTAISASIVAAAINSSIAYWKYTRFWFNTASYDSTMIAQDPKIYLPSDFLVELQPKDGFVIHYSNSRYRLFKKDTGEFDDMYSDNGYGLPLYYCLRAGDYNVYPIPDQAYTCRCWYLKNYTDLSADGDTNAFTTNAADLIKYWALSKLMAENRQDEKMETYYSARAKDELSNLQLRSSKANATGDITIHSIL